MCLAASGSSSCSIWNSPSVYNGSIHVICSIQATNRPLHRDVSQIPVVLSRANSGSPQAEFPSRFKAQCTIWDIAWLSHLIPTNCIALQLHVHQIFLSPTSLFVSSAWKFLSKLYFNLITAIMFSWYFRVSFFWVIRKTLNIARASEFVNARNKTTFWLPFPLISTANRSRATWSLFFYVSKDLQLWSSF